jgi:hypothetical protein
MPNYVLGIGQTADAAEAMTREIRKLIHPLLKPFVVQAGGLLGDMAQLGRERIMKVVTRSKEKLAESGLEPQPVQTKTLLPLLQACALEDDEAMIEMWANLLAFAASAKSVPPAFVQTLAVLSPDEARLLNALVQVQRPDPPRRSRPAVNVKAFRLSTSLPQPAFNKIVVTLFHLGLVHMGFPDGIILGFPQFPPIEDGSLICTTPFCDEFLAACTQPSVKHQPRD